MYFKRPSYIHYNTNNSWTENCTPYSINSTWKVHDHQVFYNWSHIMKLRNVTILKAVWIVLVGLRTNKNNHKKKACKWHSNWNTPMIYNNRKLLKQTRTRVMLFEIDLYTCHLCLNKLFKSIIHQYRYSI